MANEFVGLKCPHTDRKLIIRKNDIILVRESHPDNNEDHKPDTILVDFHTPNGVSTFQSAGTMDTILRHLNYGN